MPKIMWKSLHLCFPSNFIKCYSAPCLPPSSAANEDPDLPSRPSFLLINNFNLLFPDDVHHRVACSGGRLVDLPSSSTATTVTTAGATSSSSTSFESDHYEISLDSPHPDFSAAFASRRFFVSSPGRSNAITDSPETRSSELSDNYDNAPFTTKINYETAPFAAKINYENAPFAAKINCDNAVTTTKGNYDITPTTKLLSDGTAVKQCVYSPDPFTDFRQSMQEMIDAAIDAGDINRPADGYDFLHELLLSYLSLNPIDTHKFVIRAFTDIMVSLLSNERRIC